MESSDIKLRILKTCIDPVPNLEKACPDVFPRNLYIAAQELLNDGLIQIDFGDTVYIHGAPAMLNACITDKGRLFLASH